MRTLTLLSLIILVLTGCLKDTESLSKEECIKKGFMFTSEKRLNYRTGKYEMKFICLDKIQSKNL